MERKNKNTTDSDTDHEDVDLTKEQEARLLASLNSPTRSNTSSTGIRQSFKESLSLHRVEEMETASVAPSVALMYTP